jgi:predicted esterase
MTWTKSFPGFRLDPIAGGAPDALVVLLHEPAATAATLTNVASHWAPMVPNTAFIAIDCSGPFSLPDDGSDSMTTLGLDLGAALIALEQAARRLESLVIQQLRAFGIDESRLVLSGFGSGGTLVLWLAMRDAWRGAGVLAIGARLVLPFPRRSWGTGKVRLIDCPGPHAADCSILREVVALFVARGIDARGAVLAAPPLSDDAVRHGAAYLAELVATAQRGDRIRTDRESGDAE